MRIAIIYRYFWPDSPPYATMLRRIGLHLAEQGHEIVVLCGQPSYGAGAQLPNSPTIETLHENLKVIRCPLIRGNFRRLQPIVTMMNWLWFYVWLTARLTMLQFRAVDRPDLFWTASIPPVVQGMFVCIWSQIVRRSMIYHVQDVHPEAMYATKVEKSPPRLLQWMDSYTLRHARCVVSLSKDMIETMRKRAPGGRFVKINNFTLTSDANRSETRVSSASFRFVFAGNMGRFQELDKIVDAGIEVGKRHGQKFEFHFVGHGKLKTSLEQRAKAARATNIVFHDFLPVEEIGPFMRKFDAGIVSLQHGMMDVAFPSKTFTYWSEDLPVFVLAEKGTELEEMIEESKSGILCASRKSSEIAEYMLTMPNQENRLTGVRKRTSDYWSVEKKLADWAALISDLESDADKKPLEKFGESE